MPEAALSPQRQLTFLARVHQLVRGGSQFVIATHSPILVAYPAAYLYLLDEAGYERVSFAETEHYQVTRTFLQDPWFMLERLLAPESSADEDAGRGPR